jgi:hypothetical protein
MEAGVVYLGSISLVTRKLSGMLCAFSCAAVELDKILIFSVAFPPDRVDHRLEG